MENPLYLATENVEKELLMCPDALTNETQLRPLLNFSAQPFCVLELRASFLKQPSTPNARKVPVMTASAVQKRKLHNDVLAQAAESASENEVTDAEDKTATPAVSVKKQRKVTARAKCVGRKLQLA